MKTTKSTIVILALLTLSFSACKKKSDDVNPSTSTTTATVSADDSYYPTTKDNTWTFTQGSATVVNKATGISKVISGKTYAEVSSTTGSQIQYSYALRDGNKYYTNATAASSTGGSVTINLKMIDLDVAVGGSWSQDIQTNMYTMATYTMKLLGTGLTRTVNGIAYKDVISVQTVTTAKLINMPGGVDPSMFASYLDAYKFSQVTYYAKGVGLIEQTSDTANLNVKLISYTVK